MPDLSRFAQNLGTASGIGRLMDDLGETLAQPGAMIMLGGGNPAHIPGVQACFQERMRHIIFSIRDTTQLCTESTCMQCIHT